MSTSWGGMAAGDSMVYPVQMVDGELATRCPELATWISEHMPPVTWDTCGQEDTVGPRVRRLGLTRASVRCLTKGCVWTPLSPGAGHQASPVVSVQVSSVVSVQASSVVSVQASSVFSLGVLHTVAPYDSDKRVTKLHLVTSNTRTSIQSRISGA